MCRVATTLGCSITKILYIIYKSPSAFVDRPKKGGELDNFGGELSLHTIFTIPWSYTLSVLSCSTIYLSAVEQSVGNG